MAPPKAAPTKHPIKKGIITGVYIFLKRVKSLPTLEAACTTPCTGIMAIGSRETANIASNMTPPPSPKRAETKEVKKLQIIKRKATVSDKLSGKTKK